MNQLSELDNYQTLYETSPVRVNLVRAVRLNGDERVLEAGAGSTALTAYFAAHCAQVTAVCQDDREYRSNLRLLAQYPGLRVAASGDPVEGQYDLIVLADCDCMEDDRIRSAGRYLTAGGRLVIGTPGGGGSPEDWKKLLARQGFDAFRVFRLHPDHIFPMEAADERYAAADAEAGQAFLLEACITDKSSVSKAAGSPAAVYIKYSNERRPEFAVYTQILEDADGSREVRKYPDTEAALPHIRRIAEMSARLREQYRGTGIGINECHMEKDFLASAYLTGRSCEEEVNEILRREGVDAAICAVRAYIEKILPEGLMIPFHFVPEFAALFGNRAHEAFWRQSLPLTNIDCIMENAIRSEQDGEADYLLIDCEWTTEIPVPAEYLIWRIVHYYLDGNPAAEELSSAGIYRRCGVTGNPDVYLDMENAFQNWIEGNVTPLHKYLSRTEEQDATPVSEPAGQPGQSSVVKKIEKHGLYLLRHGYRGYRHMLQTRPDRPFDAGYDSWIRNQLKDRMQMAQTAGEGADAKRQPTFGIILTCARHEKRSAGASLKSLEQQRYTQYRVYAGSDPRRLTERAMEVCDYVVYLSAGTTMTPDALQKLADVGWKGPEQAAGQGTRQSSEQGASKVAELIYADSDRITPDGSLAFEPAFKPDFSIDYLRSHNYIGDCFCVGSRILKSIPLNELQAGGGFYYDMLLRISERTRWICHIPDILFRKIARPGRTSVELRREARVTEACAKALRAHYRRLAVSAEVSVDERFPVFHTICHVQEEKEPLLSIIVPNKDHAEDLRACIDSVDRLSAYRNYEWIIVENNSTEDSIFACYRELEQRKNVSVVRYEGAFNYAKINNFGVRHANGDYVLLLNNDTELISPAGIGQMLGTAMLEGVGIVGARLLYPDRKVQHGGIALGIGGIAGHLFTDLDETDPGYGYRAVSNTNYSAVTGACLLVRKELYEAVGGMEESLAVAFNDVDFCLKVRERGKRIVYRGDVLLYHKESKSRGLEDTQEKVDRFYTEIIWFIERWRDAICAGDPYYHPDLSLQGSPFYEIEREERKHCRAT